MPCTKLGKNLLHWPSSTSCHRLKPFTNSLDGVSPVGKLQEPLIRLDVQHNRLGTPVDGKHLGLARLLQAFDCLGSMAGKVGQRGNFRRLDHGGHSLAPA